MKSVAAVLFSAGTVAASKANPVRKVITMLQDMVEKIELEGKQDEEIIKKFDCWYKKQEQECDADTGRVAAIAAQIQQLEPQEESNTADSAAAATQVENDEKDLEDTKSQLEASQGEYANESQKNREQERSSVEALTSLKSALVVLEKYNGGSVDLIQDVVSKVKKVAHIMKSNKEHKKRASALEKIVGQLWSSGGTTSLLAVDDDIDGQHGQIFGILQRTEIEMTEDLADLRQTIADAKETQESLEDSQKSMIKSLEETIASERARGAQAEKDAADAKFQLSSLSEELAKLETMCAEAEDTKKTRSAQQAQRTADRAAELVGLQTAIGDLTSDDAFHTLDDTFNRDDSFLQIGASRRNTHLDKLLAKLSRNGRFSALAQSVKMSLGTSSFKEVVDAIERHITSLKDQMAADQASKDNCISDIHENNMDQQENDQELSLIDASIGQLEAQNKSQVEEIATIQTELKNLEAGKVAFLQTNQAALDGLHNANAENLKTGELLHQVIHKLEQIYNSRNPEPKPSLVQGETSLTDLPEAGTYKLNNKGNGVIRLLNQIASDVGKEQELTKNSIKSLEETQNSYMVDNEDALAATAKYLAAIQLENSDAKGKLQRRKSNQARGLKEQQDLAQAGQDYHSSCDFLLENFDNRQDAMTDDIDRLNEVKAYLAGMNSPSLLQVGSGRDAMTVLMEKLQEHQVTQQKLANEEAVNYASDIKRLEHSVAASEKEIERLGIAIAEDQATEHAGEANAEEAATAIQAKNEKVDKITANLNTRTADQQAAMKKFNEDDAEAASAILALGNALNECKTQRVSAEPAFLQKIETNLLSALPASWSHKVTQLLQIDNPQSTNYAYQSEFGDVCDMISGLKDQFSEDHRVRQTEHEANTHAFNLFDAGQKAILASHKQEIKTLDSDQKEAESSAGAAGSRLADNQAQRAAAEKSKADFQAELDQATADQARDKTAREEAIAAVKEAIRVIGEGVSVSFAQTVYSKKASALLQVHRHSQDAQEQQLASFLGSRASELNSAVLSNLQAKVMSIGGLDNVVNVIKGLIAKLETQAEADQTREGWCKKKIDGAKADITTLTDEYDKGTIALEGLNAKVSKDSSELTEITARIADSKESMSTATENREKEKATNVATVEDAEKAIAAIKHAFAILDKSHTKTTVEHDTDQHDNNGLQTVFSVLEIVEADFQTELHTTQENEEQSQKIHDKFMSDTEVQLDGKSAHAGHLTTDIAKDKETILTQQEQLSQWEAQKSEEENILHGFMQQCNSQTSPQEKIRKKEAEIESLQDALKILSDSD